MHDPVYILPHVPKTAGQTLRFHFSKHLTLHESYIHLGPWGERDVKERNLIPWKSRDLSSRLKAQVISGHNVKKNEILSLLPASVIRFVTFLRDPAERWISEYNFKIGTGLIDSTVNFEAWYSAFEDKNYQLRWLYHEFLGYSDGNPVSAIYETVKTELEQFVFIGYVGDFDKDARILMELLKLPAIEYRANVSGRDFPVSQHLTPELRERISEDCHYDQLLIDELTAVNSLLQ
jgi:hypothetical protein